MPFPQVFPVLNPLKSLEVIDKQWVGILSAVRIRYAPPPLLVKSDFFFCVPNECIDKVKIN
ncbi:MAG: hypothetical protein EAZ42_06550 [Verrucomicrobia bacterium]|nr:MAG: hypothetical protein EAZ42_06550 [Verrucomicrobiota bacterium]